MAGDELFEDLPEGSPVEGPPKRAGEARVRRPQRSQPGWDIVDLDQLVGPDDPVRLVASFVEGLDLGPLYKEIGARSDGPGRDAIDPALLLALWLYATIDGVGSAREVARLCLRDLPYRWLCGGVGVNHHALSDFRSGNGDFLDQLLTDSVTALVADGLVSLATLAHDSVKVRASAGSGSFRRAERLAALREQMEARVKALREELDGDPDAGGRRRRAARERAERERLERVRRAQERMAELKAAQAERPKKNRIDPKTGKDKEVRVSTTDPEARPLVFASGGWRPGYSLQVTCDPTTLVAVAARVHDGVDQDQLAPAVAELERRYGAPPEQLLADCGFCSLDGISAAHQSGVAAIVPSNSEARLGDAAYGPRTRKAKPGVEEWRQRMTRPEAKTLYKLRCRVECVFGQMRNRGLRLLHVRGKESVRGETLVHLLAHNMLCAARLHLAASAA
jgi:transposase